MNQGQWWSEQCSGLSRCGAGWGAAAGGASAGGASLWQSPASTLGRLLLHPTTPASTCRYKFDDALHLFCRPSQAAAAGSDDADGDTELTDAQEEGDSSGGSGGSGDEDGIESEDGGGGYCQGPVGGMSVQGPANGGAGDSSSHVPVVQAAAAAVAAATAAAAAGDSNPSLLDGQGQWTELAQAAEACVKAGKVSFCLEQDARLVLQVAFGAC